MAVEIIQDIWVCSDCLFVHANDEWPDDETSCKAIQEGFDREAPYRWACDDQEDDMDFSWRECDCCRSRLGGSRHRMALILTKGENE